MNHFRFIKGYPPDFVVQALRVLGYIHIYPVHRGYVFSTEPWED